MHELEARHANEGFRRAVRVVALLNLGYFVLEAWAAYRLGSVSLFADSVDFLEDASVNGLILTALGWSARGRARMGVLLAMLLLAPALATLWMAWRKFSAPVLVEPIPLTMTGAGALIVNVTCAFLLARHRQEHGSLSRAAFLSARNDAIADLGIMAAAATTVFVRNGWPDLLVGLGIAILNAGAAKEVLAAARCEHDAAAA